ncbi:MAG: hypothetical protein IJU19_07140 [Bacteroidales bacterium]|nr:hypothetical protein [Bacteroidales bacterium]
MDTPIKRFKSDFKTITHYYTLLVEETKNQRLVGSTNEWVLDNYYVISEQDKVLRIELAGIGRGRRGVSAARVQVLSEVLQSYLERCHYQIDKPLLFRYLSQVQVLRKDYLAYPEVLALVPLLKAILIGELASLCRTMEQEGAYRYVPTDKRQADMEHLNRSAQENLLMMNIFNSLKKMAKLPTAELVDAVSFQERMLKQEAVGMYDQMQDRTKEDYRARITRLSRKQKVSEYELTKALVAKADSKGEHVGWQLFPPKRWRMRSKAYVWIVSLASAALACGFALLALGNAGLGWAALLAVLLWVPMSQVVIDLFNWLLGKLHRPRGTFKLKFKDGLIPQEYATMVIMPTILKDKKKTETLLEQLEVYYLSNINRGNGKDGFTGNHSQNLYYTLVGDAAAYGEADAPWDNEVVEAGLAKVKELNEKYGAPIFNFVYRRRAWSDGERSWLGYERKRGAILHFNDLLLGQCSAEEREQRFRCETISQWQTGAVPPIQFVITLDTDTELVLYSAQKLIGAMAHPLNRAHLSGDGRRVVSGYGLMQPRVNVDVEVTDKSRYAQLFSGLGGLDVYTTASFELYQDIFNEGSFCGKGIYDLHVFQQVLKGTFPENLILSHDLIEGCHVRCGLINDVELFDDSPSNYIDDAKRHHRWTRGDWQILPWLFSHVHNEQGQRVKNQVNTIGRWKIFDNLRRSVLSLTLLLVLLVGFSGLTAVHPLWFLIATLAAIASPILFFIMGQVAKLPHMGRHYKYYMTLMRGFSVVLYRSLVQFALLPKEAWMYTDAAVRACWRMCVSHRNLLNWIPSDEASKSTKGTLADYAMRFWFNYVCAAALLALPLLGGISSMPVLLAAGLCAAIWLTAPLLMYSLGKPLPRQKKSLAQAEVEQVRQVASDTWHFFDSLLTEEHHWLIPDNYQLNRENKADYKTSPTNIGYSLTAVISAAQLGFIAHGEAVRRLNRIIDTVATLEKWNGHLYNWYDIRSLKALPHFFISTCDSGNFVACLYALRGYLAQLDSDAQLLEGNPSDRQVVVALSQKVTRLIDQTDFSKLYNPELDVFSIGYDIPARTLLPYHYNNFASEARLTSFLTIAQGDAPYKHWFCLDKTLVQFHGYKGVASWYGTMFEYFMPLIFLPTYKHTLMDETYNFAIRAQKAFAAKEEATLPWGISETAYNELDDAQNYKYHAFGVPYLKFQNTTPDRIVLSPYSSLMAIGVDDRSVYDNICRLRRLGMYSTDFGFFESYDQEDHTPVKAHYAHHQGMILASLANYLAADCLQRFFMHEPAMRSMETLLKEKAQVKPYIDLKITQYKRYQYSKTQTESDARDYEGIAKVPEIGIVSNGEYTVLLNDRGSGFSRFKNIYLNRYRKVSSDHYGIYLYIRNLRDDNLWSATYAPLDVQPEAYQVSFASDKIKYTRTDRGITTRTEITVLKDRSAELRRVTFVNGTDRDALLELTTYGEVVLAPAAEDENHRVFAAMKVDSEYAPQHQALLFHRPGPSGSKHYLLHKLWLDDESSDMHSASANPPVVEYETSRLHFLGRGGSQQHPDAIDNHRILTGTTGTTLDPVMSMRRRVSLATGESREAYILTAYAKSSEQLLQLSEQYQTAADVELAFKTSSVFNNMRLQMSLLKGSQMRLYCTIAKYIAQNATLGNERQSVLAANTLSQSGLWRFGISGDLDIILVEIGSSQYSGHAKEMLRAYEYFKVHGLRLDLVFINDTPAAERQNMAAFIQGMASTEHLWASNSGAGKVYILDADNLNPSERTLLRTVAVLSLSTADGVTIAQQIRRLETANLHYQDKTEYPILVPHREHRIWSDLDFYNQYGGFDRDGRDYVVTNTETPVPWVNVIANPHFGCIVSSSMQGFSFARNAQQFKLTSWSNDPVRDNAGETLLISRSQFVPATARHSQGWSAFDAEYDDFKVDVRLFVSIDKPEKYYQIRLTNKTHSPLQLTLDMVYQLVLGTCEEQTARYLLTRWDEATNSLYVRNVYHPVYRDQVLRLTATRPLTDVSYQAPNRKRTGLAITLQPEGEEELAFIISVFTDGQQPSPAPSYEAINAEFDRVVAFWDDKLSRIQVQTPDRSFNHMLNRWYLYQVYASRLFARAGFYQVGGATGFRDQLQDIMSLLYSDPAYARRQILDHAAHQFPEGDVLHWWHESLHLGARTTFSDDYLWLVFVAYQYVSVTGDNAILAEQIHFCAADSLNPGEPERGMNYAPSPEQASLYQHLRRAVDRAASRIGSHGLPLMGCGDWNDGMSQIGVQGKGESVWVALFLINLLPKMEHLTDLAALYPSTGVDPTYKARLVDFRQRLTDALQKNAWDGAWFLRAYFDNGDPVGSRNNTECQIDLITQAWAILTNTATPEQKQSLMRETDSRLVDRQHEIIRLLTPAFKDSRPSPGYIADYPIGVRENGGQYTHGAMWYIMAKLKENCLDEAYYLYSIINPIHRTATPADVLKYKVEPYCMAADIYSNPQHPGRGGWTWYTGSASWAYKTGIEEILGFHLQASTLTLTPRIPSEWDGFTLRYRFGQSLYIIRYQRPSDVDAASLPSATNPPTRIELTDDGQTHEITIN